jgi:hypothetical protein
MKFDSGVKLVEYAFLVMKSIINRYLYDLRILRKNCGSEILSLWEIEDFDRKLSFFNVGRISLDRTASFLLPVWLIFQNYDLENFLLIYLQ